MNRDNLDKMQGEYDSQLPDDDCEECEASEDRCDCEEEDRE